MNSSEVKKSVTGKIIIAVVITLLVSIIAGLIIYIVINNQNNNNDCNNNNHSNTNSSNNNISNNDTSAEESTLKKIESFGMTYTFNNDYIAAKISISAKNLSYEIIDNEKFTKNAKGKTPADILREEITSRIDNMSDKSNIKSKEVFVEEVMYAFSKNNQEEMVIDKYGIKYSSSTYQFDFYDVYENNSPSTTEQKDSEYLVPLTIDELEAKIANKDTFILVVTQTSCSHCIEYKPILIEVLEEYGLKAYEVDQEKIYNKTDELNRFKKIVSVSGTPTTIFFENGEETSTTNRIIGSAKKTKIIDRLKAMGYINN